jgi:hypothetical protein
VRSHERPLTALVLGVITTRLNLNSATERFYTIAAAQPAEAKRRKASDQQLVEFANDLATDVPELAADDVAAACQSGARPSPAHLATLRVMLGLKPKDVPDHPGGLITLPVQHPAALMGWSALMDLSEFRRQGWTLVGGQMVHLLAWEHGEESPRATTDADVVLNVRAYPTALRDVTKKLVETGFAEDGVSPDGIAHRYRHTQTTDAAVDVLLPEGLVTEKFTTITGARTISAAGSVQAIERSMRRSIEISGRQGAVIRPDLHAALVLKAAAYQAEAGRTQNARRHLDDFAYLVSLFARRHSITEFQDRLGAKDRTRISNALGNLLPADPIWRVVPDGMDARDLIVSALSRAI